MKPLIALLVGLAALAQQPALDFKELTEDTKLTSRLGVGRVAVVRHHSLGRWSAMRTSGGDNREPIIAPARVQ